jgi:hypothetical protein
MELVRALRAIAAKTEYHAAGSGDEDALDATLLAGEADRVYLTWGLAGVAGLDIDGISATAESLFTAGPEELCREVVQRIRRECFLTAAEQKN